MVDIHDLKNFVENRATPVAIWEGDAKWEVTSSGNISPCSLKRIVCSYIAENIGTLCTITPEQENVMMLNNIPEVLTKRERELIELSEKGSIGSPSGLDDDIHPVLCNSSLDIKKLTNNGQVIPYSVFNAPNYGRIYNSTDSTGIPGDSTGLRFATLRSDYSIKFRSQAFLSPKISLLLLEEMNRCGVLSDSYLSLFQNTPCDFSKVSIKFCLSNFSAKGLKFLKNTKVRVLELHFLRIFASELHQDCLSDWSLDNLTSLTLSNYTPIVKKMNNQNVAVGTGLVDLISRLTSLQELDLSHIQSVLVSTLETVLPLLPKLWKLNISHCENVWSLKPLLMIGDQLQHLSIAGLAADSADETQDVLFALKHLRYLDISTSSAMVAFFAANLNSLLTNELFAPNLEYIDLSSQKEVTLDILVSFLACHSHVNCVGIVNVPLCADLDCSLFPHIKFLLDVVSAENMELNPSLLHQTLIHYLDSPEHLIHILKQINAVTHHTTIPQPLLLVDVLRVAERHINCHDIQTIVSEILYNLTAGAIGPSLHPSLLKAVVCATIHSMTFFRYARKVSKYSLLLLCCDCVLHKVSFNRFWVAMLALHSLNSFVDDSVVLMCVGILSILAAKITREQTAKVGSNHMYMGELLNLVGKRIATANDDITLQFVLSALWNLTDESPGTCKVFLIQKGVKMFINLLNAFPESTAIATKVLGLFNNLAEVGDLRKELLTPEFMEVLMRYLQSPSISVSYFAAGITSHIVCLNREKWPANVRHLYDKLMEDLGKAVTNFESPSEEMVAYKSFEPFLPLLGVHDMPYVQLWAMWALHHVTVNNSKVYCPMLIKEKIPEKLETIRSTNSESKPTVSKVAEDLLTLVENYNREVGSPS